MERHIRWRMFLVMFIVSASPSFCPSTTMLQCLHLNFPFHVPSWLLNCHGDTNALFCVSNCSKHAAQLHILPCLQYRIECYTHIHPCERVGRKYFQEILRRMMRMEWSYICFLVTTGQSPVFLLPSSGRRQAGGDDCQDHSEICCHLQNISDGTEDWGELMLLGELLK